MESVREKVVLITGASSGIGASTAVSFAKYGSRLALTGRNVANLEKVVEECCQWGLSRDKIIAISAELKDPNDVEKVVRETVGKFGTIHVLVNNAGIAVMKCTQQMTMDEMDELYKVNLRAPIQLTKLAIPYLKQSKGSVVNVSSWIGCRAQVNHVGYSMTKAALNMFTAALSLELSSSGVRVNSVCPGGIYTPILEHTGLSPEEGRRMFDEHGKLVPLGRSGEPREIADVIVFLASDAASYVSGVNLPVDGASSQTNAGHLAEQAALQKKY